MDIIWILYVFSKTHRYSVPIYLCKGTNFSCNYKENELKRLKDWKIEASVEGAKDIEHFTLIHTNKTTEKNKSLTILYNLGEIYIIAGRIKIPYNPLQSGRNLYNCGKNKNPLQSFTIWEKTI